jgi:hypothetical protein
MIRAAYTRLWGFRACTRIALTSDQTALVPRRSNGGIRWQNRHTEPIRATGVQSRGLNKTIDRAEELLQ